MNVPGPMIVRWLFDTRGLWDTGDGVQKVKDLPDKAPTAFSFLSENEKKSVLKYYFAKDAKMSLASHLMKHLAISKLCGVPWEKTMIVPNQNKKPVYQSLAGESTIDFNVSHQAGVVALIACAGTESNVGVDVVCVNERDEYSMIDKDGLFSWIDMHEDVFSPRELDYLKHDTKNLSLPQIDFYSSEAKDAISKCQRRSENLGIDLGHPSSNSYLNSEMVIEAKLRRFYALWCLKEGYIKMSGEALLADWLRQLEFLDFRAPAAVSSADIDNASTPGEIIRDVQVYLKGQKITDICIELQAFGQKYMVGTIIRLNSGLAKSAEVVIPKFTNLQLENELCGMDRLQ